MDLALREKIASEILGRPVADGDVMPCRFEVRHTRPGGVRDLRVCLSENGGMLPTFHCFHSSCAGDWQPLNRELRRRIWFGERGLNPDRDSPWNRGDRVAAEPRLAPAARSDFDLAILRKLWRPDLGADRAWFAARSPVPVVGVSPGAFLDVLFLPGERVLIFTGFASQGQFIHWCGRGNFRLASRPDVPAVKSALPVGGPDGVWFLCQPVSGKWYPNPRAVDALGRAKLSRRSQESVTDWRYMVLESDNAPEPLWLNFLAILPLPVAAIYTSGGRSIHALLKIECRSKAEWDSVRKIFIRMLAKYGADPGALSAVRLTRLPGMLRGAALQELLFLNPDPDPAGCPIAEMGFPVRAG